MESSNAHELINPLTDKRNGSQLGAVELHTPRYHIPHGVIIYEDCQKRVAYHVLLG